MKTLNVFSITLTILILFVIEMHTSYSQNCTPVLCSQFQSQTVKIKMPAGGTERVSVTFRNSGSGIWGIDDIGLVYGDAKANPMNNNVWGVSRVSLQSAAVAGENATFEFNITAPKTPGVYYFQWQMQSKGTNFGDPSSGIQIKVF